jgi:hypothetical protein
MWLTEDQGFITLLCSPGAELAPISHGARSFEPYREHGRTGRWVVDVPPEAAGPLVRVGGFRLLDDPRGP